MCSQYFFPQEVLESVCKVLAATEDGLRGSEISQLLREMGISDITPDLSKRDRLFNALASHMNQTRDHSCIIAFVQKAMKPVRYTKKADVFELRRSELNAVLSFVGLHLKPDGRLYKSVKSSNLAEARERETRLRYNLQMRNVHPDVLRFCKVELLNENYFHAVFEATKSVAEKIREKTGLASDGAELANTAFSLGKDKMPVLAINSLSTSSEESEQKGFLNLLIGLFGTFRNTAAHAPKIKWELDEVDALDVLSLISLIHRKIDRASIYNI